ncbi:MAG: zinc-dependent alcohol dehydrogenase family protein [Pseudomonadota bacterium]
MKAMVFSNQAPVETFPLILQERPVPEPGPGELQVRVSCCAVCRTDLHVIEGDLPPQKLPLIPGHQAIGRVSKLGPQCRRFGIGDRVGVAWLRHTCGKCEFCLRGLENLCENQRFTGYHADGGYAEFLAVPEDFAYPIPQPLSDSDAVPLLCSGIIGYRALKLTGIPAAGSLALFGFGSSAHIVLQIALSRKSQVYVVTRGEKHRQLASAMGAAWVGEDIRGFPGKVDGAILFAPVGDLVPPALGVLKRGGTLSIAGIYVTDIPTLNYEKHLFYERNVRSVTANTRADGLELLAEAARIPIRPHVTTFPLAKANQALQDLKADRINGTAVLKIR